MRKIVAFAFVTLAALVPAQAQAGDWELRAELRCRETGCGGIVPVLHGGRAIVTTSRQVSAEREILVYRELGRGRKRLVVHVRGAAHVQARTPRERVTVNAVRPRPVVRVKSRKARWQRYVIHVRELGDELEPEG